MILRLALAWVFISIGIWEIIQPSYWSFYIPGFLSSIASPITITMLHGAALLILGLAILAGAYLSVVSALCALMMVAIIGNLILSFGFNDIVIRDVAILLIAVSIYFDDTNYLRLVK